MKAKVFKYKSDGNTVVAPYMELEPYAENVYLSLSRKNEYGNEDDDCFHVVCRIENVYFSSGQYSRRFLKGEGCREEAATYCRNWIADTLQSAERGAFVNLISVRVFEALGLDTTPLVQAREEYKRIQEQKRREQKEKEAEERRVQEEQHRKYSINSLVYWVTYVHNVVYSFYRSMIYCYINSTQRCAGSIVIDIIPTNGADKRKFFPFAPYFPVTNVIKRYFYPYFPAIIGIKGYSFPYFPYLSGIMKIKTALYSLFSRLDWHKTVVFPCLGEIYEGIRSLSWEIPVT